MLERKHIFNYATLNQRIKIAPNKSSKSKEQKEDTQITIGKIHHYDTHVTIRFA